MEAGAPRNGLGWNSQREAEAEAEGEGELVGRHGREGVSGGGGEWGGGGGGRAEGVGLARCARAAGHPDSRHLQAPPRCPGGRAARALPRVHAERRDLSSQPKYLFAAEGSRHLQSKVRIWHWMHERPGGREETHWRRWRRWRRWRCRGMALGGSGSEGVRPGACMCKMYPYLYTGREACFRLVTAHHPQPCGPPQGCSTIHCVRVHGGLQPSTSRPPNRGRHW